MNCFSLRGTRLIRAFRRSLPNKDVTLKEKCRAELTEANSRLDQPYAEQTMQLMAMFNLLEINDKTKLLQASQPNVIRIK